MGPSAISSMAQAGVGSPGYGVKRDIWGDISGGIKNGLTGFGNSLNPSGPQTPGTNPALAQVEQNQISQAQQFQANIPQYQQQLTSNLKQGVNQQLGQNLQKTANYNASRGLLYGGVNQGMQGHNYNNASNAVAQGTSDINAGLQSASNQLAANAVGTGTGIQQSNQDIQNQIYQQTMAQTNSNNSMLGSAAGFGLLAAMI